MNPSASVLYRRLITSVRARHLEVLIAVADLGSMRKAAEVVGLTQPAITKVIADIEQLLGIPLFLRHARGMQPGNACIQLLPAVRRVMLAMSDIAEQAASLGSLSNRVVRLLASGSAIPGFLVDVLPRFSEQFPDVLLQVREISSTEAVASLARREADLAICTQPSTLPEGWRFESLMPDRFVVVAAPTHPLANQRRVTVRKLEQQAWLATPVETGSHAAFERLFAGRSPLRLRQINARVPEILWAMLASTDLLAIAPESTVRQLVAAGMLTIIDCQTELPGKDIGLVMPMDMSGAAEAFCLYCRQPLP